MPTTADGSAAERRAAAEGRKGAPDVFTFAVVPTAALNPYASSPPPFEPFLLDVPGFALEPAARRAYFSALAYANRHGVDVDGFHVCVWNADNTPGRPVGPGGIDR